MSLGTIVNTSAVAPPRTTPAPTGRLMVLGTTASGPLNTPTLLRSVADLASAFGARDGANGVTYDYAATYFASGGAELVFVRLGASTVVRDTALYAAALDTLDESWGPGQVAIPGEVGDAHTALLAHAAATKRTVLLDEEEDTTQAERLDLLSSLASVSGAETAGLFGPWETVPSPTVGATVTVPASAHVAGVINRTDTRAGHAGYAPIADQGQVPPAGASTYPLGLAQSLTTAEQEAAFAARYGLLTIPPGARLPTLQSFLALTDDPAYSQLTVGRMAMDLSRRFDAIGYLFRGRPLTLATLAAFRGSLEGELLRLTTPAGPVYETGDPLRPPYVVDVGPAVNNDETIAAGEIRAAVTVRLAPYIHSVTIDVVTRIAGS